MGSNPIRILEYITYKLVQYLLPVAIYIYIHMAMTFLGVCNARRATNLVTEVCNGGPCYAGL